MMKFKIVGLIVATILGSIVASTFGADLNLIVSGGKTYRINSNPAGGIPVLEEVSVQIMYLDGNGPIPGPQPPTGSPFQSQITNMTKNVLANGGSATTGAGISSVFSLVRDSVQSGTIAPDKALDAVRAGIDLILSKQTDKDKWASWRTSVSDALLQLQQERKLVTKEDFANIFKQIADGMNAATGFNGNINNPAQRVGSGILDNIDIQKLIELIRFIMELIKLFSGGAVENAINSAPDNSVIVPNSAPATVPMETPANPM